MVYCAGTAGSLESALPVGLPAPLEFLWARLLDKLLLIVIVRLTLASVFAQYIVMRVATD